jgi:hypothetical protein
VDLVEARHERRQVGDRRRVIGAVHCQHLRAAEPGAHLGQEAVDRALEPLGHGEEVRGVVVPERQVLGGHL